MMNAEAPSSAVVPVMAMPAIDPGSARVDMRLREGSTVEEIVALAMPGLPAQALKRTRVVLVAPDGRTAKIPRRYWHRVRPHGGVHVVIRVVPGKNAVRAVLKVVVAIAAIALAAFFAPALAGFLGISTSLAQGLIGFAVTAVGNLLINALIPARQNAIGAGSGGADAGTTYTIEGFRNDVRIDAPVPTVLGRHRFSPPFAATPYTEVVGDDQYIRAALLIGYGRMAISGVRIGQTPIDEFEEVELEIREGLATDDPLSLYPSQVIEKQLGIELTRDLPRDGNGNVIAGSATEQPQTRFTAGDVSEAAVIIGFPQGMVRFDSNGNARTLSVSILIEARQVGDANWTEVTTLDISAKKPEPFFRVYRWELSPRGRYEIRLTRMTDERPSTQLSDRTVWVALQSFRPEYPLNFDQPLSVMSIRIKATHQLNGPLDEVNLIAERYCLDWDTVSETWLVRLTRNPASLYRYALQGPENAYPVPDAEIDLDALADWHEFCSSKGLEYNRVHDFEASLMDVLGDITAAGRATPSHDGIKWSVVIDRPRSLIVDHVSERNSRDFRFVRSYFTPPHGFRITFPDETADYAFNERVIPWPGHVGEIDITEELILPGKTDPDEIWREARRKMYELIHRPDRFSALQDGVARVATRGDLVEMSHNVLDTVHSSHRVRRVTIDLIELDSAVTMEAGTDYALRYMVLDENGGGVSHLTGLEPEVGSFKTVRILNPSRLPAVGDIVLFGSLTSTTQSAIVQGVEAAEDMASNMIFVAAAPIIDTLTDAEAPPVWDGRVGSSISDDATPPAAPTVLSVDTTAGGNGLVILLAPGSGSTAVVASYRVEHRLSGAATWTEVTGPAGGSGITLSGYAAGQTVDYQAFAVSAASVEGVGTGIRSAVVANPAPIPAAPTSASVVAGRGSAVVTVNTPSANVAEVRVYRGPTTDFADATRVGVATADNSSTVLFTDGDATRPDLMINGGFDTDTTWVKGTGWTIAAGLATHAAGNASDLTQPISVTDGKTYRYCITVSGQTAGSVSVALQGSSTVAGSAHSGNDTFFGALLAVSGQDTLAIQATSDFDGSVDKIVVFEPSTASIDQGTHHYFATAANDEGAESSETSAGAASII